MLDFDDEVESLLYSVFEVHTTPQSASADFEVLHRRRQDFEVEGLWWCLCPFSAFTIENVGEFV